MTFEQYHFNEIALNVLTPEETAMAKTFARFVYEIKKLEKLYKETGDESYKAMANSRNSKNMEFYQAVKSMGTDMKLFNRVYDKFYRQMLADRPL